MIGADTIGIYNIDNDSISIQIKEINTYFSSKWSDTILIVLDTTSNYFFEYKTICQGDSVLIGNNYEKEPVTFTDTLQNEYGCDSIIVTELIVHPTYSGTKQLSICQGDSVLIGSYYEKVPGIYADTLQNQFGCDSIIINHLSVDTCNSNYSNLHFKDCKIYPNPFSDFIIIANKNIVGDVLIKILDNKGAVLYEDSFNNTPEIKLKTEFLERGLYTVVLQSENEARQIKIIKIN